MPIITFRSFQLLWDAWMVRRGALQTVPLRNNGAGHPPSGPLSLGVQQSPDRVLARSKPQQWGPGPYHHRFLPCKPLRFLTHTCIVPPWARLCAHLWKGRVGPVTSSSRPRGGDAPSPPALTVVGLRTELGRAEWMPLGSAAPSPAQSVSDSLGVVSLPSILLCQLEFAHLFLAGFCSTGARM